MAAVARASRLTLPTLRDAPADAVAPSHQLLVRAGAIRQVGAGMWTFMPLGLRTFHRVCQIIREEMDAIGGQEMLMPILHPAEIWRRSGRYPIPELFKLQDRAGRDLVLAMTHEEIIALHASTEIRSYRDLPQIWYHIQFKERDEPRPQAGLLRTREFVMKDSYTLDRDQAGLDEGYAKHEVAYDRIFRRCGLDFYKVESDTGMMGGSGAHEYMAPSPVGEDRIALTSVGAYAANVEMAVSTPHLPAFPPSQAPEEVETPNVATIADLAGFLGIDERLTAKAVLVVPEDDRGGVVLAIVRGDHRLHDLKLQKLLRTSFRAATPEEIRAAFGADPGSIGPLGVDRSRLRSIVLDEALTTGAYVCGANRTGWHVRGVEHGRDFTADVVADIRHVEPGEIAPDGGTIRIEPAIEIGNIFKLGTTYAEAFGATYLDESGTERPIVMGSYGIGPARTMAAIVEQRHDAAGISWPQEAAPYDVWIIAIGDDALAKADEVGAALGSAGISVLIDDRPVSPGIRFADADLIGCPLRVTIGKRLATEGTVSLRHRRSGEEETLQGDALVPRLAQLVAEGLTLDG